LVRLYYTLANYPHEMIEIECASAVATAGCGLRDCSRSTDLTSSCRTSCG
jgi:hypothetical protein